MQAKEKAPGEWDGPSQTANEAGPQGIRKDGPRMLVLGVCSERRQCYLLEYNRKESRWVVLWRDGTE